MTRKLAVIGASELQEPLIEKAHELGLVTHVFAWEAGDIGERTADVFHPISIVEKDAIAAECARVGVDGVATIASDLANITVASVADELGLTANSLGCVARSTNKHLMRETFEAAGCPSPRSRLVRKGEIPDLSDMCCPLIVKPTDRSGSRAITKVDGPMGTSAFEASLASALEAAWDQSFEGAALVEEWLEGQEYSVEFCSWQGHHTFLALTQKQTTGAPHFIETGHLEPAPVDAETLERVRSVVGHALDALGVTCGASHSEIKIAPDGSIGIVEIGSRMGGDCIGSDLVHLSTGVDFVRAVVQVALGEEPDLTPTGPTGPAEVRYILGQADLDEMHHLQVTDPGRIVRMSEIRPLDHEVTDSGSRFGFYIVRG
ncbi:MAG: ATP-grasp domain-containing protein [Atopobiaceae bacterium]|jgi:biotin carboxylase|nr:ATP-grasp domain-containing protein [Atopobiaceae bacterium]MCH4181392.1 ATP-grasp domain-containing protein [Atopobiaceae bacterium]MCH4215124.1 ATP-grasp domain-containing protein [Atopobiaceae bacterium]MCH4230263.1 ATP-grasp domain-containing protein [Atopobiaceae bacterium]MCH4276911.1 ATP-grasp domain-containing protein [Atopobiaceae bacterium]